MDLGLKIKNAIRKVGVSYSIIRSGEVPISGEYLTYDQIIQSARPFFREYASDATLSHDTQAIAGDILHFHKLNQRFILSSKVPEMFKNEVATYSCMLFKCNVRNGLIKRSVNEDWDDQTYHKEPEWGIVEAEVDGLMTPTLYGNTLDDQEMGDFAIDRDELYIKSSIDLRVNDRFEYPSGEYYKVVTVRTKVYEGLILAEIANDTRGR